MMSSRIKRNVKKLLNKIVLQYSNNNKNSNLRFNSNNSFKISLLNNKNHNLKQNGNKLQQINLYLISKRPYKANKFLHLNHNQDNKKIEKRMICLANLIVTKSVFV